MALVPSPINRVPQGLLDFLGIRTAGRNPQTLTEQLLPMMDLTDWYRASASIEVDTTEVTTAVNVNQNFIPWTSTFVPNISNGTNIVVPQNEIWVIRAGSSIHWRFTAVAAQSTSAGMVTLAGSGIGTTYTFWPMRSNGFTSSDAAVTRGGYASLTETVWALPGNTIQGFQFGTLAAANTVGWQAHLSVVRMRL